MGIDQLEARLLDLPVRECARLAEALLASLDGADESDIEQLWLDKAQCRAREVDDGIVQPISAEEFRRRAHARFK